MSKTNKSVVTPPTEFSRNEHGLISSGLISYVFNEDGSVDWRKMVRPEFLKPNRQKTQETDLEKLRDDQLIILLGGIKELAQIRGYTDVKYDVTSPSPDYVVATCTITWIPNYETEGRPITFSAIGDASPNNTNNFARNFLGPIAENRAFVRCVRNFLRINIVAQEELGSTKGAGSQNQDVQSDPKVLLGSLMTEKGVSFEALKTKLKKEGFKNADTVTSIDDLPKIKVFELIKRLKSAKQKK